MAGLPDLKQIAKSAMDKITGGYAASDEMEEEEVDISDDIQALADVLHQDGPDSPRAEKIIAKLEEHGLSRAQAIKIAGKAYGLDAGGESHSPAGELRVRVMFDKKTGQIKYPEGTPRGERAKEKGSPTRRMQPDKKGDMIGTKTPRASIKGRRSPTPRTDIGRTKGSPSPRPTPPKQGKAAPPKQGKG
mgnify:CR=1 FL=1